MAAADRRDLSADGILAVHVGHSANCSSVGSIVDYLFVASAVASAVVTAVLVLARERDERDEDEEEEPKR